MIVTVPDTDATGIHMALVKARHSTGGSSTMVFTMIVIADPEHYERALKACEDAGREHPSRIILVTNGSTDGNRLDAEIRVGQEVPGEILSLRFHGELTEHRASVVLALLLPDSPVVTWWPDSAPDNPGNDPLGRLAVRRITDAVRADEPIPSLERRARHHSPGDTDLTWTRLTPWRALLAAALDSCRANVTGVTVDCTPGNAASLLLAAWLEDRLKVPVVRREGGGTVGINFVAMATDAGDIVITRENALVASFSAPGRPRRQVALRRRAVDALIIEELRRLDVDEVLADAMRTMVLRSERNAAAVVAG